MKEGLAQGRPREKPGRRDTLRRPIGATGREQTRQDGRYGRTENVKVYSVPGSSSYPREEVGS